MPSLSKVSGYGPLIALLLISPTLFLHAYSQLAAFHSWKSIKMFWSPMESLQWKCWLTACFPFNRKWLNKFHHSLPFGESEIKKTKHVWIHCDLPYRDIWIVNRRKILIFDYFSENSTHGKYSFFSLKSILSHGCIPISGQCPGLPLATLYYLFSKRNIFLYLFAFHFHAGVQLLPTISSALNWIFYGMNVFKTFTIIFQK